MPASPLEGICPAVIEDVFALAVVFQVGRNGTNEAACSVFQQQVVPQPASLGGGRAGVFHGRQEFMRYERVVRFS